MSIASPLMRPFPNGRRVGIRIVIFEARSGFTHVSARWIAQSPKATFVTRFQPCWLPKALGYADASAAANFFTSRGMFESDSVRLST